MAKKRFLVEIDEPGRIIMAEHFGVMELPWGSKPITVEDIKKDIKNGLNRVIGDITVTELPDAPKQEAKEEQLVLKF